VSSPDRVRGEGVAAELVRVIRKIHQVERRLADIAAEMTALKGSETHVMKLAIDQAASEGRDLLGAMATDLRAEIASLRASLAMV
jgi:hypothetical protein